MPRPDPFLACCIPDCETPLLAPIDLFCEAHLAVIPAKITEGLELELKRRGDIDLRRWHELVDQARQAVAATG